MSENSSKSSVFEQIRGLMATDQLPELGPGPRSRVDSASNIRSRVEEILGASGLAGDHQELILSLVLLWHDHLEASHDISQGDPSIDGSYVHGIMHRREPDYSNAKYWFRRVGTHPVFNALAAQADAILSDVGRKDWIEKLMPSKTWDSFAMVDLCEAMGGAAAAEEEVDLVRRLQAAEFETLLGYLCGMN